MASASDDGQRRHLIDGRQVDAKNEIGQSRDSAICDQPGKLTRREQGQTPQDGRW